VAVKTNDPRKPEQACYWLRLREGRAASGSSVGLFEVKGVFNPPRTWALNRDYIPMSSNENKVSQTSLPNLRNFSFIVIRIISKLNRASGKEN